MNFVLNLILIRRATNICYIHDHYGIAAKKIKIESKKDRFFEIEVKEAGTYYVMVNQHDSRVFKTSQNYKYSCVSVLIAKEIDSVFYQYKKSFFGKFRDNWGKIFLEPGKYIVNVLVNWDSFLTDLTLSVYGPGSIGNGPYKMDIVDRTSSFKPKYFFEQVMDDMMTKNNKDIKTYDNFPGISYTEKDVEGFVVFQLTNFSESIEVTFTITYLEKKNFIPGKSSIFKNCFDHFSYPSDRCSFFLNRLQNPSFC